VSVNRNWPPLSEIYHLKFKGWSRTSLWSYSPSACDTFKPQVELIVQLLRIVTISLIEA
jgi:hypothetical protein